MGKKNERAKQDGGVGNSQCQEQASESYLPTLQQRTDAENMKVAVFDIIAQKSIL